MPSTLEAPACSRAALEDRVDSREPLKSGAIGQIKPSDGEKAGKGDRSSQETLKSGGGAGGVEGLLRSLNSPLKKHLRRRLQGGPGNSLRCRFAQTVRGREPLRLRLDVLAERAVRFTPEPLYSPCSAGAGNSSPLLGAEPA